MIRRLALFPFKSPFSGAFHHSFPFSWGEGLTPKTKPRRIVASRFTPLVGLLQFRLQARPGVGYIASVQFQVKAFTGRSFEKGRIMEGTWTKQRQNGGLGICILKFSYQKNVMIKTYNMIKHNQVSWRFTVFCRFGG